MSSFFVHVSPNSVDSCYNSQINRPSWPWEETFIYIYFCWGFCQSENKLTHSYKDDLDSETTGDICSIIMKKYPFFFFKNTDTRTTECQGRTLLQWSSFHVLGFYMPKLWCLGFEENPQLFRQSQLNTTGMIFKMRIKKNMSQSAFYIKKVVIPRFMDDLPYFFHWVIPSNAPC